MSKHTLSPLPDGSYEDDDPIMAEVRRIKAARLAKYGNDIHRMIADDRRQQYLDGYDLYGLDAKTGRIVRVFKGSGQPVEASDQ
jgi:hypothetical protein